MPKINGKDYFLRDELFLLEELEHEIELLQAELNKMIVEFIANHRLKNNINILAFDMSFAKLSEAEKLRRLCSVQKETFLYGNEFIVLKPELIYDKINGEYSGGNYIVN